MNIKVMALAAAMIVAGASAEASADTLSFKSAQFPGTGVPLSVTGSDGTIFTFAAGAGSQFEAFNSGFVGSFPLKSSFLTEGLGQTDPITITFSQPISSILLPVASDRVGDTSYTTTVAFFDGGTLVDTITKSGNTMNPAAVFGFAGAFTSAVVSTVVPPADAMFGYTQNIGSFNYNVANIPLPPAAPLFGAALVVLGAIGFRLKRGTASTAA